MNYFSDFLGSLFWGFVMLYFAIVPLYGFLSLRDFFSYRPPRNLRDRDSD